VQNFKINPKGQPTNFGNSLSMEIFTIFFNVLKMHRQGVLCYSTKKTILIGFVYKALWEENVVFDERKAARVFRLEQNFHHNA